MVSEFSCNLWFMLGLSVKLSLNLCGVALDCYIAADKISSSRLTVTKTIYISGTSGVGKFYTGNCLPSTNLFLAFGKDIQCTQQKNRTQKKYLNPHCS